MKKNALLLISFFLSTLLIVNTQVLGFESAMTDSNLLEEPYPFNPYAYENYEPYLTNITLGQVDDNAIECIDIGDADNDGDTDIVLGTEPQGLVILYENVGTDQSIEFVYRVIANFSNIYQSSPVHVVDVVIGDLEGTGNNSILIGTWYFNAGFVGDVIRFDKSATDWEQTEILNGLTTPVIGGVYSISVGEIGSDASRVVVVGGGAVDNLGKSNVTVYKKESSVWVTKDVAITNQTRVDVCIGDYSSIYDGNEIVYCTYATNSTLGYVAYEAGFYYPNIIANYTIRAGHSPPYTRFMNVNMGDFEGDGIEELIVAVQRDVTDSSSIKIYNETHEVTIVQDLEFIVGNDFEFGDFDNDERDEFIYVNTTSVTFPTSSIYYYDWNGTAGKSIFLENSFETYVPTICTGDVDNDGDIEMLYGTKGNGWLILWDYVTLPFEQSSTVTPVASLIAGPFSVDYQVRFFGWNTQNINLTIDLPAELTAQGQLTSINLGDKFAPGLVSQGWLITALDYGLLNLDLITNTTNAGDNFTTDSVIVTDLEVYNTEASSTTAVIGNSVTISGYIVYIHDKSPVENAVIYLDGDPVRITDDIGFFSFQRTELTTGTQYYNITSSLEGEYDFENCAINKIIEIEWVASVPEFSLGLISSILILVTIITQVMVVLKKK